MCEHPILSDGRKGSGRSPRFQVNRVCLVARLLAVALAAILTAACNSSTTTSDRPVESKPAQPTAPSATTSDSQVAADVDRPDVDRPDDSSPEGESSVDRDAVIARSMELAGRQNFAAAESELTRLLVADPLDQEVKFRLAGIKAQSGDLPQAIELLSEIPIDHPQAGLAALGQSADWCFQLERYDDAEKRYLKVLELVPQAAPALRQLAYILNRQGRRHEAANYVRELCKLGDVRQDELHSLIVLGNAMYDDPSNREQPAGARPYWPIGASGLARKRFSDQDYPGVIDLLLESIDDGTASPAAVALFGLAAVEAQDDARFQWWLSLTDDSTRQFAEYWAALGAHLLASHQFEPAVRALGEAIDRDPTDLRSMSRIRQALLALDQGESSERFVERWEKVRETLRLNNRIAASASPDTDTIVELSDKLKELNRPLESVLWKAIEQYFTNAPTAERLALDQERRRLIALGQTYPSASQRLCGLDLQRFPLPEIKSAQPSALRSETELADRQTVPTPATLVNVAQTVGLNHTYRVESRPVKWGFAVYQILGGAVVAFDYDLDGNVDLYFAQGGGDPPDFQADQTNQLFRKLGESLSDVTEFADAGDQQYTIGATAGDWNQDGFPDLVVTNLGVDSLLINNGDGTFSRQPLTTSISRNRIPSSVAIADLNGDRLPDIYQANYVDDPRMVLKPTTNDSGQPILPVLPSKYDAAADRLIRNDGAGGFVDERLTTDPADDRTSLGLVITDFDNKPGVEIFVANDMNPNQLWTQSPSDGWQDVGTLRGCAYSFTGAATAAMGVAAGDLDGNGTIDLHVTNYEQENVSLFLSDDGTFQDRNIQYRLAKDSHEVLGFGTQAIDYDNDGLTDLVVANGHIEDAVENKSSFRQLPQLFSNLGGQFQLAAVSDESGYWSSTHLGRGLATLDYNRDGKRDVVITHIDEPSALLLNQTPTDHHWLQLKLIGTTSERDSVGARVRVQLGSRELTDWVIAGDGYLCHNEDVVCFGLGGSDKAESIEVRWPSGQQQVFSDIQSNQRLLLIEGQSEPFALN